MVDGWRVEGRRAAVVYPFLSYTHLPCAPTTTIYNYILWLAVYTSGGGIGSRGGRVEGLVSEWVKEEEEAAGGWHPI